MNTSIDAPFPYFGNHDQQQAVIDGIVRETTGGTNKLHLIAGPTGTGKSTAYSKVLDRLDESTDYEQLSTLTSDDYKVPSDKIPKELAELLIEARRELGMRYYVYKHKTKPEYIVAAEDESETNFRNKKSFALLKKAGVLIQRASANDYSLSWVAESAILGQGASVFKPSPTGQSDLHEWRQSLAELQNTLGDVLAAHRLTYDTQTIRETLWNSITSYGKPFLDELEIHTDHWDDSPEWKKAREAALAGNRKAYDVAIDAMAKRATEQEQSRS